MLLMIRYVIIELRRGELINLQKHLTLLLEQLYCSEQCRLKDAPSIPPPSSPPMSPKMITTVDNTNNDDDIQLPPLSPTTTCIEGLLPSPPNTPVTTIQYLNTSWPRFGALHIHFTTTGVYTAIGKRWFCPKCTTRLHCNHVLFFTILPFCNWHWLSLLLLLVLFLLHTQTVYHHDDCCSITGKKKKRDHNKGFYATMMCWF